MSFRRLLNNFWCRHIGEPARRGEPGYPSTFQPVPPDPRAKQPKLFDPALKGFRHGLRMGEPAFEDAALAAKWRLARREVMDHLLRIIVESPWREHLVLRGSLVMRAWFGDDARDPGDMDFVVQPHTVLISQPLATEILGGLVQRVHERPFTGAGGVQIAIDDIATDQIWTYDRAPGRRIVFPFRCGELPAGTVQVDFVFGEGLLCPPVQTAIPRAGGGSTLVFTADKELSLAWKLLWLLTDAYPQGKDLYDAVLLAESTRLPRDLLERTLLDPVDGKSCLPSIFPQLRLAGALEWESFQLEYPWIGGDAEHWQARLINALAPTFAPAG
jgi:hypothetical protein